MKTNNLTLAVLIALGAAACGGNGDSTAPPANPQQDNKPAPQPKPDEGNKTAEQDQSIIDPTGTHVVDNRDLSKESTVGGLQYIRREGSTYDRVYNPDKPASATPLLGVSLNEQNPKLTNIVLARRDLEREENQAVRAQFAGGNSTEPLTYDGKPQETPTLQNENFKNVDVLAGAFKQVGSAVFDDPNNRLDPSTHNISTHIQNNTDKDGEFTRERVTHVYTPRYEYRQPYVDYPHAANPADIGKEHVANQGGPVGTSFTAPPAPPLFDNPYKPVTQRVSTVEELEARLINSGNNPEWVDWATKNVNDNSRHVANIGTNKHYASGEIYNDADRYGSFNQGEDDSPTNASGSRPATTWRNDGATPADSGHNDRDDASYRYTDDPTSQADAGPLGRAQKSNLVDWNGARVNLDREGGANSGAYHNTYRQGHQSIGVGGNKPQLSIGINSGYRNAYPNGAYPIYSKALFAYPNVPYDEANNNAIDTRTNGVNENPMDHEHIYLEREEYTAIRQIKNIRPLVNPVPNEWDWRLNQTWGVTYHVSVQNKKREWDAVNNTWGPWQDDGPPTVYQKATALNAETHPNVYDNDHTSVTARRSGIITDRLLNGTNCGAGPQIECTISGWEKHLISATWDDPKNLGGGQRGEFRGPPYIGWKEDDRVVRFADPRIWQKGASGYRPEYENKYGANLIWWSTQDSAFENHATSNGWEPRARRVDINTENCPGGDKCGEGKEDLVWGKNTVPHGTNARDRDVEIQPTGDITNGLIRIGGYGKHGEGQPEAGNAALQMKTLGEEMTFDGTRWKDHHKTSTRIFGHYHLAYANVDDRQVKAMSMNSYSGVRSFVSQVEKTLPNSVNGYKADLDSKPTQYSIGAQPITLHKVQYGRVTSNLDLTASGANLFQNGFLRAPFEKKGTDDSVDNYFFRGVDATTIEQMNALPSNLTARYEGHALMYGIDNSFHGVGPGNKSLPNAFNGIEQSDHTLGLGNFVEANVNFGTKKVNGDVYNAWLKQLDKPGVYKDRLVTFSGDIIGNTVIGTADRVYAPDDDQADFRAAFFGENAEEMGGSFNSVKATNKYGSAYEVGDWGGVFGATKTGSSNTFQGDDSGNNYGGTTGAPQANTGENRYAP